MKIIKNILSTQTLIAPLVLRVALGIVLFPHGAQKLLGWFGGHGFSGTMNYFTTTIGLTSFIGFMVIFLEFFGALFIFLGLFTRLFSLAALIMFIGMVVTVHYQFGFFMNWTGNAVGEGFEYHLLVIGILSSLIISGSGKMSLDKLIYNRISNFS